jgi:eukaryotic-like serine/threonine-protein kinase
MPVGDPNPDVRDTSAESTLAGIPSGAVSALLEELFHDRATGEFAWDRALRPGAVIGRFHLLREVGRGGFGVVYEAQDLQLRRMVAFKAIRYGAKHEISEQRWLLEAETAARLSHPSIVTLFDVGRCEHGPYLILEFLRGCTLGGYLERERPSMRDVLRIGVEVSKGLAHAHARGVIHRDLTPGNVFLCEDQQVKILDLGMAHAFGHPRLEGGTPAYMAPEQLQRAPEDERTDVFALGVLLYRMLTGELPFPDDRGNAVLSSRRAPVLDLPAAPALGPLLGRMLERDPANRMRDAIEVLAALRPIQEELEQETSSQDKACAPTRARPRLGVDGIVAACLRAVTTLTGTRQAARQRADAPTAPSPSIAVLPFADLSARKDEEYFSDGLSEEILHTLAGIQGLHVAGRASSFSFKGKNVSAGEVGRLLNVGTVLEGSVRRIGNRIRVTAHVVSAANGYELWSEEYEREVTDVFAVQDEIAAAVAKVLKVRLFPAGVPRANEHRTDSAEAYAQYLLAKNFFNRGSNSGYHEATRAYEDALTLDSNYSPAWAGLAVALRFGRKAASSPGDELRAFEAAERAIRLAPDLADGYAARAFLRGNLVFDWSGALEDFERALSLRPADAEIRRRYGVLLASMGRLQEGVEAVRVACSLDPLAAANWSALGFLYEGQGELDLAHESLERALAIAPRYSYAALNAVVTYLLEGRPAEALGQAHRAMDENYRLIGMALAQHDLLHAAESQHALDQVLSHGDAPQLAFQIAAVYAWRGEHDQAFQWLERAYSFRDPGLAFVTFSPAFRTVRDDARYRSLLGRLRLPAK